MTTTNTLHTPRFLLPVPTWNADWQKWQQTFETFANGVDSSLFSLLEHVTLIPRVLPTVSIAGGVFSQSGPAQFISRTLQVEVGVGPNPLTLVPRALVCAHLQSGAVGPQSIEWELRITNTEVDADLVVFGVVGDDYSITWYNGSKLVSGTPMALFAFPGTGGASSLQAAYEGGSTIAIPSGGNPVRINNGYTGRPSLALGGTGPQRIKADDELELADGHYTGILGPAGAIPLTNAGARDFTFPCTSLVDAVNKAHGAGSVTFLESWDQAVGANAEEVGYVNVGIEHGICYSLRVEIVAGTTPLGADIELADATFAGSHELLYQIGLDNAGDPRWVPSVHPTWKDRTPFGIEGLVSDRLHWRLSNLGAAPVTFRVTLRGMGWS
jgi:hypothetical protein